MARGTGSQPIFLDLHGVRGQLDAQRENGVRLAFSLAQCSTNGAGEVEIEDCLEFDCIYIEQPNVAYGSALDSDRLVDGAWPRITAGVSRWRTDPDGNYTGCWVFICVDHAALTDPETGQPVVYDIDHFFTFAGLAGKYIDGSDD